MVVPLLIFGTEFSDGILAEPPRQRMSQIIFLVLVTLAAELLPTLHSIKDLLYIVWRAGNAVQTEVFGRLGSISIAAMIHIHLALQPSKSIRAGTEHSILLFLGVYGKVQCVVRILVSLDAKAARSAVTVQVADRLGLALDHFEVAEVASPALVTDAALVTRLWILFASPMVGAEGILLILVESGRAVRRALLLTAHSRVGNVICMSRVAIAHRAALVIVRARRPVVAVLLRSTPLNRNLTPQTGVPVGAHAVLTTRRDDVEREFRREGACPDEVVVGLESLGAHAAVALEVALLVLVLLVRETFLLEELAVGAGAVGGAVANKMSVDPMK